MTIAIGLTIAFIGAFAVACCVLALSNLYVGQWLLAGGLAILGSLAGVTFFWGFGRFLVRIGADETDAETAGAPPPSLPLAPSLLSSFWLLALAGVLGIAALSAPGTSRYLTLATALSLLVASVSIFWFRSRPDGLQK